MIDPVRNQLILDANRWYTVVHETPNQEPLTFTNLEFQGMSDGQMARFKGPHEDEFSLRYKCITQVDGHVEEPA
jgi:hypothetical protein